MTTSIDQRTRLLLLLLYLGILCIASLIGFNAILPPTTEKGLWFYAALASLILGDLLITPFYTKPADAISYSVAGLIGMLAVKVFLLTGTSYLVLWYIVVSYLVLVVILGILSIATKDSTNVTWRKLSTSFFVLTDVVGNPKFVFSSIFLFALVSFHRNSAKELFVVGLAWAVLVPLRPFEHMITMIQKVINIWGGSTSSEVVGEVLAHREPRIFLLKKFEGITVKFGDLLAIQCSEHNTHLGLIVDNLRLAGESWTRIIEVYFKELPENILGHVKNIAKYPNVAVKLESQSFESNPELQKIIEHFNERLIGIVSTDTNLEKLQFEIVRSDVSIEEGRLVQVRVGDKQVVYQVVNGLTKEEILYSKNSYGYARVHAKKIGVWNHEKKRFEKAKWIPSLNEPVFLMETKSAVIDKEAIGYLPGTDFYVSMNISDLVTHNAAILGILGVGKTFLALELIERMIDEDIKVICLDLTNQYAEELKPYYNKEDEESKLNVLYRTGVGGKTVVNKNVEEGGSVTSFSENIQKYLYEFLKVNKDEKVKIFNPSYFEVWKQDSKPYQGNASMATLTPTEITRIIVEETLKLVQDEMSKKAKVCIVFEEAHSLIPEWNSVASEGDKTATNGTARAILQGRKYGLGCLVVTQRTANVTKSILNQCNTVFALRVFDSTGMDFLSNYIGADYSSVLSTLDNRHAVVFGKASSCNEPVMIHLNDRDEFLKKLRE